MWGHQWLTTNPQYPSRLFDKSFDIQTEYQNGEFAWLTGEASKYYPTIIDLTVSFSRGSISYPTNGGFGQWVSMTNLNYTTTTPPAIPEPTSIVLMSFGLLGLLGIAMRRRKRK
jgi:hypothetical protein